MGFMHFDADREAIALLLRSLVIPDITQAKVVRISNTLDLNEVEVSEIYADEISGRDDLEVIDGASDWSFNDDGNLRDLLE